MLKKLSTLALAAMIALPSAASAGGGVGDLAAQIDRLTQDLAKLKQEMATLKNDTEESTADIEERAELWDLASRFQWSGDARTMLSGVSADTPQHWTAMKVGNGIADWKTTGNVMNRADTNLGGTNVQTFFGTYATYDAASKTLGNVVGAFVYGTYAGADGLIGTADDGNLAAIKGASTAALASTVDTAQYSAAKASDTAVQAATTAPGALASASGGGTAVTDNEKASMDKVFKSPTVGVILAPMMLAPISGVTPNFTDTANLTAFMKKTLSAAQRNAIFNEMGYNTVAAKEVKNDTIWTNRLRLNMRVKATENLEFKGRLAMYKAWGMQNNPVDYTENAGMGGGPFMLNSLMFDGSATRQPTDSILRVDRAFLNWNNIGGQPVWFSIGRRPTTDGPPAQLRLGADKKMATPVNYMDYPFDGFSLGYAYNTLFGMEDFPGRIRFCYGRGFESGPTDNGDGLKDVDFGGLSWDVYHKGDRFFNIQSFGAFDMFNVPDNVTFVNPIEYYMWQIDPTQFDPTKSNMNLKLDRANLGNIYHTDAVYMSKVDNLNYFLTLGWSHTNARGMDELGTSLLGSFFDKPQDKDGYSFYVGLRYDIPEQPFKLGLEYNHGTKNWISFTPGNDDLYASKLATRGDVVEAYTIWDIPAGETISKFGKAFIRLGYQHYEYDYTGSGFWLGEPLDIDQLANDPLSAQFYTPVESMDQIYLSLEGWF